MRALERAGVEQVEHGYDESGDAGVVEMSVPHEALHAFADELREGTAGAVAAERLAEGVLYRNGLF